MSLELLETSYGATMRQNSVIIPNNYLKDNQILKREKYDVNDSTSFKLLDVTKGEARPTREFYRQLKTCFK